MTATGRLNQLRQGFDEGDRYVLVIETAVDPEYYAGTNLQELLTSCLVVLQRRWDAQQYSEPDDDPIDPPSLSREEATAMPLGQIRGLTIDQWGIYDAHILERDQYNEQYAMIQAALHGQHGADAFTVLWDRRNCDSEGFQVELLHSADDV